MHEANPMVDPIATPAFAAAAHPPILAGQEDRSGQKERCQQKENAYLAAAIELQSELDRAITLEEASHQTAHRLAEILAADRVIVAWRDQVGKPLSIIGEFGTVPAGATDITQRMEIAAAEETLALDELVVWPPQDPGTQSTGGLMAVAQAARTLQANSIIGVGLTVASTQASACLLVFAAKANSAAEFVNALSLPLASKLHAIRQRQPSRWESAVRSVVSAWKESRTRFAATILIALVMLLFAPATYTLSTDVEVQPVLRRFVAAPFDGPLKTCHVRPGDTIRQHDVLAIMDGREIEYELAGLRAELEQANQQKNAHKAEHDFSASRLAELESQRLQFKADLLAHRQSHLEIRSPVDGMVISGDWRQAEGMPLSQGEELFEVAPLSQMVLEVLVPESEIPYVRTGMTVTAVSHGAPGARFQGKITHVHPAAQLRDSENVFVAEVRVDNPDGLLQPGMKGKATIYSDRHAIGWNLFHRPWYALRTWLGV